MTTVRIPAPASHSNVAPCVAPMCMGFRVTRWFVYHLKFSLLFFAQGSVFVLSDSPMVFFRQTDFFIHAKF